MVLEVEDAFCPWNAGRWRLTADAKGAVTCERTDDEPELALSVRELGAAYLGGVSLTTLAGGRAGAGAAGGRAGGGRPGLLLGRAAVAAARILSAGGLRGRPYRPAADGWQAGHQKRLRAARSAVRISVPQMWQACLARR